MSYYVVRDWHRFMTSMLIIALIVFGIGVGIALLQPIPKHKKYTERVRNEETTTAGKQARIGQLRTTSKGDEVTDRRGNSEASKSMYEVWSPIPQSLQRE